MADVARALRELPERGAHRIHGSLIARDEAIAAVEAEARLIDAERALRRYRPRIDSDGEIEFRVADDGAWVLYSDVAPSEPAP